MFLLAATTVLGVQSYRRWDDSRLVRHSELVSSLESGFLVRYRAAAEATVKRYTTILHSENSRYAALALSNDADFGLGNPLNNPTLFTPNGPPQHTRARLQFLPDKTVLVTLSSTWDAVPIEDSGHHGALENLPLVLGLGFSLPMREQPQWAMYKVEMTEVFVSASPVGRRGLNLTTWVPLHSSVDVEPADLPLPAGLANGSTKNPTQ